MEEQEYYFGIPIITWDEYERLEGMLPDSDPHKLSVVDLGQAILKISHLKNYIEFEQDLQYKFASSHYDNDDSCMKYLETHWLGYEFMYGAMAYVEYMRQRECFIDSFIRDYHALSSLYPIDEVAIDVARSIRLDEGTVDIESQIQGIRRSSDRAAFDFGDILFENVRLESIIDRFVDRKISIDALESRDMEASFEPMKSGFYEGVMQATELMVVSHRTSEFFGDGN